MLTAQQVNDLANEGVSIAMAESILNLGLHLDDVFALAYTCGRVNGPIKTNQWNAAVTLLTTAATVRDRQDLLTMIGGYDPTLPDVDLKQAAKALKLGISPRAVLGHVTDGHLQYALSCLKAGLHVDDLNACTFDELHALDVISLFVLLKIHAMPGSMAPILSSDPTASLDATVKLRASGHSWDDLQWLVEHRIPLGNAEEVYHDADLGALMDADAILLARGSQQDSARTRRIGTAIALTQRVRPTTGLLIASSVTGSPIEESLLTFLADQQGSNRSLSDVIVTARGIDNDLPVAPTAARLARPDERQWLRYAGVPAAHMDVIAFTIEATRGTFDADTAFLLERLYSRLGPETPLAIAATALAATAILGATTSEQTTALIAWAAASSGRDWAEAAIQAADTQTPALPADMRLLLGTLTSRNDTGQAQEASARITVRGRKPTDTTGHDSAITW